MKVKIKKHISAKAPSKSSKHPMPIATTKLKSITIPVGEPLWLQQHLVEVLWDTFAQAPAIAANGFTVECKMTIENLVAIGSDGHGSAEFHLCLNGSTYLCHQNFQAPNQNIQIWLWAYVLGKPTSPLCVSIKARPEPYIPNAQLNVSGELKMQTNLYDGQVNLASRPPIPLS